MSGFIITDLPNIIAWQTVKSIRTFTCAKIFLNKCYMLQKFPLFMFAKKKHSAPPKSDIRYCIIYAEVFNLPKTTYSVEQETVYNNQSHKTEPFFPFLVDNFYFQILCYNYEHGKIYICILFDVL